MTVTIRSLTYWTALVFSLVSLFFVYNATTDLRLIRPYRIENPPTASKDLNTIPNFAPAPQAQLSPRISIIIIWEGNYKPYLNNLFTSFRANLDYVELVFIQLRHHYYEDDDCLDVTPWAGASGATNIKAVCLDWKEYWELHRDYFCDLWNCTQDESDLALKVMLERSDADEYKSSFRIWRGYVFKKFMHPGVGWWGWADPDTFMGNFQNQFPWDMTEYDVLVPAHMDEQLFYMRGHLCFFRVGQSTQDKLNQYPQVSSLDTYIADHRPYFAAEEADFSAFVFQNPAITFLILPHHLTELPPHQVKPNHAKLCTLHGAFVTTPDSGVPERPPSSSSTDLPILNMPAVKSRSAVPTFSSEGTTRPIDLLRGEDKNYTRPVWFPMKFATYYEIDWSLAGDGWRRFVGRGGEWSGGSDGVWERVEPPVKTVTAYDEEGREVKLREGLYMHFFEEKRGTEWFKELPRLPLERHQTFAVFFKHGAEVWDHSENKVIWEVD